MLRQIVIVTVLVYYADSVRVDVDSTTPPSVDTRFFGLNGILGQLFHGHHHQPSPGGFGGFNQAQYPFQVQQNPQQQSNWQNDRGPQLFPSQGQNFNGNSGQYPAQSNFDQGNFNPNNNFGVSNQNLNAGTLDDIPSQNSGQMQNQNFGNQGFQTQNGGNQGFQNQNDGNQGFQNPNGGNQGFQNQNPVAILGRPVPVPSTSVPDRIVFQDGSDTPAQIQCVQDCQSTTEYSPVCGSNNITYFNPGRFVCARNCGINVFLDHPGRCFD